MLVTGWKTTYLKWLLLQPVASLHRQSTDAAALLSHSCYLDSQALCPQLFQKTCFFYILLFLSCYKRNTTVDGIDRSSYVRRSAFPTPLSVVSPPVSMVDEITCFPSILVVFWNCFEQHRISWRCRALTSFFVSRAADLYVSLFYICYFLEVVTVALCYF